MAPAVDKDELFYHLSQLIIELNKHLPVLQAAIGENDNLEQKQMEILSHCLSYLKSNNSTFTDYELSIELPFMAVRGLSFDQLNANEQKMFLDVIYTGFNYAGEPNERGRAYRGGEYIRKYAQFLDISFIKAIIDKGVRINKTESEIDYTFKRRYLYELIDCSRMSDNDKVYLKTLYFERFDLNDVIFQYFQRWAERKASDSNKIASRLTGVKYFAQLKIGDTSYHVEYSHHDSVSTYLLFMDGSDKADLKIIAKFPPNNNDIVIYISGKGIPESAPVSIKFERDDYTPYLYKKSEEILKQLESITPLSASIKFQLLYLYTKNLYNIKEKEIIFSRQYHYRLSGDTFYVTKDVKYTRSPTFFSTGVKTYNQDADINGVDNIHAIIGKNGSGKTSIVKLLFNSHIFSKTKDENLLPPDAEYFLLFQIGQQIYYTSNTNIKPSSNNDISIVELIPIDEEGGSGGYDSIINTKIAFISNVFDFQNTNQSKLDTTPWKIDLSTQTLFKDEYLAMTNNDLLRILNYCNYVQHSNRQNNKSEQDCFQNVIVRKVHVRADKDAFEAYLKNIFSHAKFPDLREVNTPDTNSKEIKLLNEIIQLAERVRTAVSEDKSIELSNDEFGQLLLYIEYKDENMIYRLRDYEREYWQKDNEDNINRFYKILYENEQHDIHIEDMYDISKLYTFIHSSVNYNSFFSISLPNMSSGEMSRLILFARIFSLFKTNENLTSLFEAAEQRQNYIIILDEAELYFHPSWQREIVYDLITFFTWIREKTDGYSNLHLILSSNSPFFISDLPKENIIFLSDNDKKIESFVLKDTFAQNIHLLLKNSFFMKGAAGKFAEEKIKSLLGDLSKIEKHEDVAGDKIQRVKEDAQYMLSIIGEPILYNALQQRFDHVFNTDSSDMEIRQLEREIAQKQQRLKEIKGESKGGADDVSAT